MTMTASSTWTFYKIFIKISKSTSTTTPHQTTKESNMDTFKHNKSLGQNFLTDTNLLRAIVSDAEVTEEDTVVEVGAGAGALTIPLSQTAKRVISYEIDSRLIENLEEIADKMGNLTIKHIDIMKAEDSEFDSYGKFKVVANLPYYITTPIIFKFLELNAQSITIMVQKEVADRIVAKSGGKDYGLLSIAVQLRGKATITRNVGRNLFTPPPNVDSAVVRIDIAHSTVDNKVMHLARSAFSMRRKTLVNCLNANGYDKAKVLTALDTLGFRADIRGEKLSPTDYVSLSHLL